MSVHTFDIKSKVTRKINVPVDADGYIPRIRFTQDPNKLAVMTLNRHQNRFDLYFADPRSTVAKLALRDESDTYIRENVFDNIIFYPENFSFVSEKSGYNHLYWYSIGGNLLKQVTAGQYEVQEFLGYDPEEGSFYFSSNEESPMRSAIYKIDRKGKRPDYRHKPNKQCAVQCEHEVLYEPLFQSGHSDRHYAERQYRQDSCHPDGQCGIEAGNQRL